MSATLAPGRALRECVVAVTPRSFGMHDSTLRAELEAQVGTVRYRPGPLMPAELVDLVADADGLLAGVDEIDATVFARAPRLRVVARYGVGVDRVDLDAARRHGVVVTTTPGANANAVAELAIALLFATARPITRGVGAWQALPGVELEGRTLGLVGLGRIGTRVAEKARGLGMRILAHDPYVRGTVPLHVVQDDADFLSLHAPLTEDTRGLVDDAFLERVKPGAALINTARGELVDEAALVRALDGGRLRIAALDVLAEEPPRDGHPLLGRDDVIVTPHMGPHTAEATTAMGRIALDELLAVLSGREPRYAV